MESDPVVLQIIHVLAERFDLNYLALPEPEKDMYSFRWNIKSMATGLYFISVKTAKEKCTRKLMVVK